MIVRKTTPEEGGRVNELFAIAFEQPLQNCPADPDNPRIHHWAAFDENREMMSTLTISDFQIHFDGRTCLMGGVGGVATLPQYRRRGGIRSCFRAALGDMYESGYVFSYLYPFSAAYYRKFGYECCVQKYQAVVHLAQLKPPAADGSCRLAEGRNPMTDAIQSLDRDWESRFNMMVRHEAEDYGWTRKADPAAKQEFTYVYFRRDGTPAAYTTFRKADQPDGRNLVCSRFCFADREGFAGLMQLFHSLSSDHMFVKFSIPAVPAMQYLMPEWSLGAARWTVEPAGMVRVVNVRRALELARYRGSGAVTLHIRDEQIPENDRTFFLTFAGGRAVSVEETAGAPDAVLPVSAFSALLSGVCDFAEARQWFPELEVRNSNAPFEQIFYRKPLMITDYF